MPVVIKAADQTITSQTTYQNDDELSWAVAANESWFFELFLMYDAHATPDMKFTFDVPANATITWTYLGNGGDDAVHEEGEDNLLSGFGTVKILSFRGKVLTGATAGLVRFQWAQRTSSANATIVKAGSYIVAHEIGETALSGATIIKTLEEVIQSTTTYQNDDELHIYMAANEVLCFMFHIIWNTGATPDIKLKFTGPTGATMFWQKRNTEPDFNDESDVIVESGPGANRLRAVVGIIYNGSTAGEFRLQWAQNTSDASDTKVLAGSALIIHKE